MMIFRGCRQPFFLSRMIGKAYENTLIETTFVSFKCMNTFIICIKLYFIVLIVYSFLIKLKVIIEVTRPFFLFFFTFF